MAGSKQASFTLGEVSPSLHGKADSDLYGRALKRCRNFVVHSQGGASNRPGTEFVAHIPAPITLTAPRMIPFHFSSYENYMLVFSNGEIRIIKDGALLQANGQDIVVVSPYLWNQIWQIDYAQSGDTLILAHGDHHPKRFIRYGETDWRLEDFPFKSGPYAPFHENQVDVPIRVSINGEYAEIYCNEPRFSTGMLGMPFSLGTENYDDPSIVNWGWGTVTAVHSAWHITIKIEEEFWQDIVLNHDFKTDLNAWKVTTHNPGDVQWDSTRQSAKFTGDWAEIQQSLEGIAPNTYYRISFKSFFESSADFDGPVLQIKTADTHAPWAMGDLPIPDSLRLAWTKIGGEGQTNGSMQWKTPNNIDEIWLALHTDCGDGLGGNLNDNLIFYLEELSITVDEFTTYHWRQPAWCPGVWTYPAYPKHVEFYEQRLCWSNTLWFPQGVWMSRTGNFYDYSFHTPFQDDDSIYYQLASRRIDPITWMEAASELIIGTASTVWRMSAGSNTQVITPYSVTCRIQAADGCAEVRPLNVLGKVLYLQRGFKSIRDLSYSWEQDKFLGFDMTYGSKHIFESRSIHAWDYEATETSIVWCAMNEGLLAGMTYFPEQDIYAWHVHKFEGAAVTDVAVLHNYYGDMVYIGTFRDVLVNGAWVKRYYVERLKPRIELGLYDNYNANDRDRVLEEKTRLKDEGFQAPLVGYYWNRYSYWHLDCATRIVHSTPSFWLQGLQHLAGNKVYVLADGALYKDIVVPESGTISIDHTFTMAIVGIPYYGELVTLPINARVQGNRRMVINEARIKFDRTRSAYVSGGDDNAMEEEVKFRDVHDGDNPIELRSGVYNVPLPTGWGDDCCVKVISRDPVPTTVLSIDLEVEAGDR